VIDQGSAGVVWRLRSFWNSMLGRRVLSVTLMVAPLFVTGQTRLEQLESTYQSNLRTLHAPVLQDYLRQLELLKSKYASSSRAADLKHVETEIARVKAIVNTTGVMPYTELEAELVVPVAPGAPAPKPAPPPAQNSSPLPTLLAASALKSAEIDGQTGAIPLGSAEWRLFKLPTGTYDVLLIFASEALSQPQHVTLNIGGREFKSEIAPARATGSVTTFRLLKLCQVKVDSEISGGTLSLTAASQGKPLLWVKKVMFTTPKKGPPPPPSPQN
jgi:hypothetical protein